MKSTHSKMDKLWYTELKMQEYLSSNKLTPEEAKTVFSFRTRMAKFQSNFRGANGHMPCPLCLFHIDSQDMSALK